MSRKPWGRSAKIDSPMSDKNYWPGILFIAGVILFVIAQTMLSLLES